MKILKWLVCVIADSSMNLLLWSVNNDIKNLQKQDDTYIFIKANKQMIESIKGVKGFINAKNPYSKSKLRKG